MGGRKEGGWAADQCCRIRIWGLGIRIKVLGISIKVLGFRERLIFRVMTRDYHAVLYFPSSDRVKRVSPIVLYSCALSFSLRNYIRTLVHPHLNSWIRPCKGTERGKETQRNRTERQFRSAPVQRPCNGRSMPVHIRFH